MNAATNILRIAAAQYPIERFKTLAEYKAKLSRWVGEAVGVGTQLLVFPEYGAMEYAGAAGTAASSLRDSLTITADAMVEMGTVHAELARRHRIHILAASGPCKLEDKSYVNRATLYAPSGSGAHQDKMIMTPFERDWGISPGSELRVFETAIGAIGVAICYDSEFPLLVRALVEAGADIILIPSCTEFASGYHRVRTAAMARALENGCVTVQSPTVGEAQWLPAVDRNYGAAGIYVPAEHSLSDTGVVSEGIPGAAQWVCGAMDMAELVRVRSAGEMRNSRDWNLQPGAAPLAEKAMRIALA